MKEFLSHTADIKIKLTSDTLPNLFQLALNSMNQLLSDNTYNEQSTEVSQNIDLKSPDATTLLIDFLSEVLTLSQIHKAIFDSLEITKMTDCTLIANLTGKKVKSFKEDVKAVTYHEAEVKVNDMGDWETVIIFDI